MRKILMYQHSGSFNHGCEALVKSVSAEIRKALSAVDITVSSGNIKEDKNITGLQFITSNGLKKGKFNYLFYHIDKRLFNIKWLQNIFVCDKATVAVSADKDCCISVGGDNYCYSKGKMFWATDRMLKKQKCKMMLWGASIEPKEIPGELAKHLKVYDLITARESYTYDALVKNGLGDRTKLVSDPAFLLKPEFLGLPAIWKEGQMIGINLSPLILKYSKDKAVVIESICKLIDYILETTEMNVALIPHVRKKGNDDVSVLLPIFEKYKETKRIVLLDDISLNCNQLKGYISRCRFFVGARTHSIIAAYSTGVPAIALGYSIKARGIAKDLFGFEENLVLPVQAFENASDMIEAVKFLFENEEKIKQIYSERLDNYIEKAKLSAKYLSELLNGE